MNARVPLPAGTTLGKSHEWGIDIDVSAIGALTPTFQPARRISDFQPTWTPKTQDVATYDDLGSENEDVVAWSAAIAFNILGNRSETTGKYLPEIEALRGRTTPDATGGKASVLVRWYHKPESGTPDPDDAYEALVRVSWSRVNTGADGSVERFAFTLNTKGPVRRITNPFTGWAEEPGTP